ncbi:MAG: holo-ACP synthase [Cyanobacteria bacterium SZAS LIN-2]|nr:holo-ACP synthase [Cyanobacteria bacterium SZAS LIN-3]MBS1997368.1 holo-ACP synthase [Cyanobacteria bacterium SZAS LIN-2]MBS2006519.1 holo-ACP synthase [Cyanobacteria bacterium SZAS TMP-1]
MTKFKVGSDICSIKRVEEVYTRYGEKFLDRILTASEKAYALSRPKDFMARVAGRFAAKEATSKVLGTGFFGIGWKDIEVVRLGSGEPTIKLHGRAIAVAERRGLKGFELTMSHEREYAIAFVLGYGD